MLKYGIYTRKSDDDRSVTEKSIGEQRSECQKIVEYGSLSAPHHWEESQSAKYPNVRPQYSEMLKMIERGKIQGIVCWHINRLVRNMEEGGKLAQLLIDGKIQEIRTPSAVYRTGDNIMPLVIEAASATQYSLDRSKDVTRGMEGSFRTGGCVNAAPQGYRNIRNPLNLKQGAIEKDPERFLNIRRFFDLMLTGTHTVARATDTLNWTWGFRTRPSKLNSGKPLSYSGAFSILTNPFYAGYVRRNGELAKGKHEPMLALDEFERLQKILKRKAVSRPRKMEFAFTGLMHCAECGQRITGEVKKLRDGRLWENYHCADSKLKCTKQGLSREKVEEIIFKQFSSLRIDPDLLECAFDSLARALKTEVPQADMLLDTQEAALKQSKERLKKLDEMWLDGLLQDRARYEEIAERELAKLNELTLQAERVREEQKHMQTNLLRARRFLLTAGDEMRLANDSKRKKLCSALAVDYRFSGRTKHIEIQIHPLLVESVKFAKDFERLEPSKSGSQSTKEAPLEKALLYGGPNRRRIEPPEPLLNALEGELFPDLWQHLSC